MKKKKVLEGDVGAALRLACFMDAYRQAGYKPKDIVNIVCKLPGGERAVIDKAFMLTIA